MSRGADNCNGSIIMTTRTWHHRGSFLGHFTSFIWPGPLSHIVYLPKWRLFLLSLSLWDLWLLSRHPIRLHRIFPFHQTHPLPHHHSSMALQGRDQVHLWGRSLPEIALLDTLLIPWVNCFRTSSNSSSFVSQLVSHTKRERFLFIIFWFGFYRTSKQFTSF